MVFSYWNFVYVYRILQIKIEDMYEGVELQGIIRSIRNKYAFVDVGSTTGNPCALSLALSLSLPPSLPLSLSSLSLLSLFSPSVSLQLSLYTHKHSEPAARSQNDIKANVPNMLPLPPPHPHPPTHPSSPTHPHRWAAPHHKYAATPPAIHEQ
jgi:hypothetical protein